MARPAQPELFAPGQDRSRSPETAAFYAVVLRLRARGHRVFRAGTQSVLLDGRRMSRSRLLKTAALLG